MHHDFLGPYIQLASRASSESVYRSNLNALDRAPIHVISCEVGFQPSRSREPEPRVALVRHPLGQREQHRSLRQVIVCS